MRFDKLIYNAEPGNHVSKAAEITVKHGFAGFYFNDIFIRRHSGDTASDLVSKYIRHKQMVVEEKQ